jgi:hypothetical protein
MPGNGHVRFGGRAEETDRWKRRHRASVRPYSWNVYAAVAGKDSHRWWCWVFVGPDTTVFTIAPSRSTKVLTAQLGIDTDEDDQLPDALPGGRELLLSSDFYAVYQSLGRIDGVDNLWCWSQYAEPGIMRNLHLGRRCSPRRRLFRAVGC